MTALIETKYLNPTNFKGSRIKATHTNSGTSVTICWNYSVDEYTNHTYAFRTLLNKLKPKELHVTKELEWVRSRSKVGFVYIPVNKKTRVAPMSEKS